MGVWLPRRVHCVLVESVQDDCKQPMAQKRLVFLRSNHAAWFFFLFFFCTSASWTWSVNATVLPILSCYAHRQWRTSTFSRCPSSKNFCTGLCMCGVWNGCVLIWLQFFLSVLILAGFDWGYVYAELFWLTLSEK